MAASISEPFLLASYSVPIQRSVKPKTEKASGKPDKHVYATHAALSSASDGYVTATVQRDGVHVLDVSTALRYRVKLDYK